MPVLPGEAFLLRGLPDSAGGRQHVRAHRTDLHGEGPVLPLLRHYGLYIPVSTASTPCPLAAWVAGVVRVSAVCGWLGIRPVHVGRETGVLGKPMHTPRDV